MKLLVGSETVGVLSAQATWNQRGEWSVELGLNASTAPEGEAVLEHGAVRLRGTLTHPSAFAGRAGAVLVGGKGKLSTKVQPRQYRGAPLSLILSDLSADSGELVQATTAEVGGTLIQNWARPAASPRRILDDICRAQGDEWSWRTTDAGAIVVGPEAWPTVTPSKARVLDEVQRSGLLDVDDELLELRPGTIWDGRKLAAVQARWTSEKTRTKIWLFRDKPRGVADVLARAVESRLPSPIWTRLHPCEVHSQDGDRTLQLIPDSDEVPPMVGIPLRTGVPGLDVEVLPGARVLLAFDEGDPRQPWALPAFDRDLDKLKALHITADSEISVNAPTIRINDEGNETLIGDTPANPMGRVGDLVQITMAVVVPDPTQGVALASPVGPVTGTIGTPALPVIAVGQIVSGKDAVKA